jgi:host factor-I protein
MDKPAQNIQDSFLNNARKDKGVVTIYLLSGVKLSGRIRSFDKYSLVMETNNQEQLIFKHAISTVVTTRSPHSYAAGPSSPMPVASGVASGAAHASGGATPLPAHPAAPPAPHPEHHEG